MRTGVFFILSFIILECQSLSLTMNRDVTQDQCSAVIEPPTAENSESCKAPIKEDNNEGTIVTIEDPSSSFFVHFRDDKKKDDSAKNFCGKPILTKKATGLDSEGVPLKKVIIKSDLSNHVRSLRDTAENNQYQNQYEASLRPVSTGFQRSNDENEINSDEDMTLALYGTDGNPAGYDNIANPDYFVRAISGVSTDQYGEEL